MYKLPYQMAKSSKGTYHIYTADESPYSIYLPHPIEHYIPEADIIVSDTYHELKYPKYVSDSDMFAGLRSVIESTDTSLSMLDLFILATHYPPVHSTDFYKSVRKYRTTTNRTYPTYDEILVMASVDNMVAQLRRTFNTNTTLGTAKKSLLPSSDFSNGFYRTGHVRFYDLADNSLDQFPVLLIVAWSDLLTYVDAFESVNLAISHINNMGFHSSLNYINSNQQARKLVMSYMFSGQDTYSYVKSHYNDMISLFERLGGSN